ncbi:MAG: OmpA family protein [Gammaproteobacteria bacterium]|nr:OmpA family protein [Gammaproteobacteria bacterium]NIN62019.1 OmpA family protein [Gammaproteobacteria bacterium]NIO62098.1 OmpA family protein [Gammaproteobacteria bacterium]NIQ08292.1 OmpA family protein [Gammaproteobacteria bacterium]NIQ19810.1 OmpA family protein [Gammaproteobacteria bacterium]
MKQSFAKYILEICLVLILAGCTTLNPETGEREPNRTGTGATVGAASGALIGFIIGDDVKSAIIGAGVGGLTGAAVGHYMDEQERKLREDLDGTGVVVTRAGDNIQLKMPSSITFDSGMAVIKPEFHRVLDDIGDTLVKYESTVIQVAGHTDSVGSAEYNQQLSINRANSVKDYLVRDGVIAQRLLTTGYGESAPIADNATAEGRQQNRRVEITVQPLTK